MQKERECSAGPNAESPRKINQEVGKRRSFLGLEESHMGRAERRGSNWKMGSGGFSGDGTITAWTVVVRIIERCGKLGTQE